MADDLPVLTFPDVGAFRGWLAAEHSTSPGIWLSIAKKGSGRESVTYAEALEVALCFGWIDGQKGRSDDPRAWLQRFAARRPRSRWSKVNVAKATELIERGEMQPAGRAEVERAQADGRWAAAYDPPSTATVPPDLQAALDADPGAAAFFASLTSAERYSILFRVQEAKRPETRARRIAQYVELLAERRTLT